MQLKNALWRFALNFYQQPGVEQNCLALQHQFGLSINRLIYACWCGVEGIRLKPTGFESQADRWQAEISLPLRVLRYKVRQLKLKQPELEDCYTNLRQAELACEQVELALLFELAQTQTQDKEASTVALVTANLNAYLQHRNQEITADLMALINPLSDVAVALVLEKVKG